MFITVGGEKPILVVERKVWSILTSQVIHQKILRADEETMSTCQHKTKHM